MPKTIKHTLTHELIAEIQPDGNLKKRQIEIERVFVTMTGDEFKTALGMPKDAKIHQISGPHGDNPAYIEWSVRKETDNLSHSTVVSEQLDALAKGGGHGSGQ